MSTETTWVSVRAVAWILDDAPVPAELIPVLLAIAVRTNDRGKGACELPASRHQDKPP